MKNLKLPLLLLLIVPATLFSFIPLGEKDSVGTKKSSFYDFKFITLDGEEFLFSSLKGKKVLIVNTASKCGNTPQYKELEELYTKYGPNKFVVIGFPANNFGRQEPGTNEEIKTFCTKEYAVTFPMMEKIDVIGENQHELYKWLTKKELNGVEESDVRWNFQKYLVDEKGSLKYVVEPSISPLDELIIDFIKS